MKNTTYLTTPSRFASHPFNELKGNLFPNLTVLWSYGLTFFFLFALLFHSSPVRAQEVQQMILWNLDKYNAKPNVFYSAFLTPNDSIVYFDVNVGNPDGVLIGGVIWATRNVDMPGTFAENPEDDGMLYQWGSNLGWSSVGKPLYSSDGDTVWKSTYDSGNTWKSEKDPCPIGWRLPTYDDFVILRETSNFWYKLNGNNGRFFGTGIDRAFLPAAGYRNNGNGAIGSKEYGYYWCTTVDGETKYFFYLKEDQVSLYSCYPATLEYACAIRCVKK